MLVRDKSKAAWLAPIAAGRYDIIHFEFSGIAVTVSDLLPHLRPPSCSAQIPTTSRMREPVSMGVPIRRPNWVSVSPNSR